jgi:hypothetical protein
MFSAAAERSGSYTEEDAMPCPFFEPLRVIASAELRNARLPLIEEYAGRCLNVADSPEQASGYQCNHGYARGLCKHFPPEGTNGANRYSLVSRSLEELNLLLIREEEYAPAGTRLLHFSIGTDELLERDLDPATAAQAAAFCRSYLNRHEALPRNSQ